jgi:OPA family glycerol-3-phosphate transporter-like MFS transporter
MKNRILKGVSKGQFQAVLFGAIGYFFYYLCRYNYPVALPFIKKEFGESALMIGWIATSLTLGYMLGQLVNGFLVDRKGPKIMMAIGGIGSMIANFFMGGNALFYLFIAGWSLNGYFQAMGYPSAFKLIVNWFKPSQRGKAVGVNEAVQSIASILILPFAGWLASIYSWRLIFFVPGVLLGIMTIVYYLNVKESPTEVPKNTTPLLKDMLKAYKANFGNWRLVFADVSYGCVQFVRYAMITWIPTYLFLQTNMGIFKAAIISMTFQIGGVAGSLIIGLLADSKFFINRKWVLITIAMAISGFSGMLVGVVDPSIGWPIILTLMVCGAGIEAIEVAYWLIPAEYLGEERASTGVGCMNAVGKGFASIQGAFLGWIIDTFTYGAAFGVAGIFGLLAAIFIIPSGFGKKRKVNAISVS